MCTQFAGTIQVPLQGDGYALLVIPDNIWMISLGTDK